MGSYRHRRVTRYLCAPERCLGTYEYQNGVQADKELQGYPGTYGPIRSLYVPGHHSGANLCPGTTLEPIFAWAPFRCLHVPNHH